MRNPSANGTKGQTDWNAVNWRQVNRRVRNLRQRIFRASRENDLRKVRSLQTLMLRSYSNTLKGVRQVAKTVTPARTEVPVFDEDEEGELVEIARRRTTSETVSIGMIRRQCTTEYKIVPIRRKLRELAGLTRKRSPLFPVVESWLGISTDEIVRAKPSFEAWQVKRFPLVEQRMSRQDCLAWLRRHDYREPPKSACVGCPFHDNARWRQIRDHDGEAWVEAVEVDRALRRGLRGIRGEVFLHRSCAPLDEADLSTAADHGQLDLWPNECEGVCGV